MKQVKNIWGETRDLRYENIYMVSSNFHNNEFINSPDQEKAVRKFAELHPKIKNNIDCELLKEIPKWVNIKDIVEV